ncbi:MAG: hypothetical protein HRU28_09380 [Rhizobiales bacterium]|nr:hypothetical protein [Hyphomicrobiales bacterium]
MKQSITLNNTKKILKHKNLKFLTLTSLPALLTGCIDLAVLLGDEKHYHGTNGDDVMAPTNGGEREIFYSSFGADTITGYNHHNIYSTVDYARSNVGVKAYLDGQTGVGGHAEGDVLSNINHLIGSQYNDLLVGDDYENGLDGNAGDDTLIGDGGNDWLTGGSGADILDGGLGEDTARYLDSPSGIIINLTTNIGLNGDAEGDKLISIENIYGTSHADNLTGNSENNTLNGSYGNDFLYGLSGNDQLDGGFGNDVIYGGDGNDVIDGGEGNDLLYGGAGNDTFDISYSFGDTNHINGGEGVDVLKGRLNLHKDENVTEDNHIGYAIQKDSGKIIFSHDLGVYYLNSIENIELVEGSGINRTTTSIDVKEIWDDLAAPEQAKFNDEADFLSWLGDDAGYNYEGL